MGWRFVTKGSSGLKGYRFSEEGLQMAHFSIHRAKD